MRVTVGHAPPLLQQQELVASVERVGRTKFSLPRVDDFSRPQARYLHSAVVQSIVQALPDAMPPCELPAELTLPVEIKVAGNGSVSEVLPGDLPACIQGVLSATRFPEHDAAGESVRFTIYQRSGRMAVSPVAELVQVPVGPVLVHPLGAWSPDVSAGVAGALGHPLTAPKKSQR